MNEEQEQEWIFTFGFDHKFPGGFVAIWGTAESAREEMFRRYGRGWSMQYSSREEAGVYQFGLQEIK